MKEQRPRVRRSSAEWAVRGALAMMVALLGFTGVRNSLAEVTSKSDPALGHALAPGNGRIAARLAQQELQNHPSGNVRSRSAVLARLALERDATATAAIATLGLQAQSRGDVKSARRLFGYAEQLSRRDLSVHIWAIEDAVSRGDIRGALVHYDIALRTSKYAPGMLFPVLATATAEAPVRSGLVDTLARRPAWSGKFVSYLSDAKVDPHARAALFAGLQDASVPVSAEAVAATINGLVAASDVSGAWAFYGRVRGVADPRRSRDPQFTANLSTPSLFDWAASPDPNLAASFQRGAQGGVFDFSAPSGAGGLLLQQMQVLPVGIYRLEGHSAGIDQTEDALPFWTLTCRNGRELGRVTVPRSTVAGGGFGGVFTVPSGCPVQVLALVARPSDGLSGVEGQIDNVRLFPIGSAAVDRAATAR